MKCGTVLVINIAHKEKFCPVHGAEKTPPRAGRDRGNARGDIGAGPSPIETSEGWLLFYHGVLRTCSGYIYSMGAMLLDLEQPWKVIAAAREAILCPEADYELVGLVPGVCFPVGCLCDGATGRTAIYYAAADTFTALCYCDINEVVQFIKANPLQ